MRRLANLSREDTDKGDRGPTDEEARHRNPDSPATTTLPDARQRVP
jgi:hypothetical protein